MNERIRELMLQAGYAAPELAGRANILAELIVRECFQVVDDFAITQASNPETYLGESLNVSMKITETAWKIKEHFGVE